MLCFTVIHSTFKHKKQLDFVFQDATGMQKRGEEGEDEDDMKCKYTDGEKKEGSK